MGGDLEHYRQKLPATVTVLVTHDERGFAASVMELPHCHTQADTYAELVLMVNDAIFTYLDIPTELIGEVGFYAPKDVVDEYKRTKWQGAFEALAGEEGTKPEIFAITTSYERRAPEVH